MLINKLNYLSFTQNHCINGFLREYYHKEVNSFEALAVYCVYLKSSPSGEFSQSSAIQAYIRLIVKRIMLQKIPILFKNTAAKGYYTWDEETKRGQVTDAGLLFMARLDKWYDYYYGPDGPGMRFLGKNCPIDFTK